MNEKRYSVGSSEVVLALGDITKEPTAAIVNAANGALLGGGGVDGAIHRAAGPELLHACREVKKTLPGGLLATGGAVITPGFLLAAEWVIHCVGPVYSVDRSAAPGLLARCYQGALAICKERGLASVAFPAISTGVFGYPMDEAALVSLCAIRNHLVDGGGPSLVKVVLFDARAYAAFVEVGDTKL
jgi:O-acetyl-ADP-ribose deacetylase (regulator of RNase III)